MALSLCFHVLTHFYFLQVRIFRAVVTLSCVVRVTDATAPDLVL